MEKKREKLKTHQRVLGDRQFAAEVAAEGVDVRRLHLLDDLLVVRGHHLAARGAPLLGASAVVVARGVAGIVSGLWRREVDADRRVRAVDGGVDASL